MTQILPWHETTWQRISAQIEDERLPHALLITGPENAGQSRFVDQLAMHLLCQGGMRACGTCSQCQLLEAGTHPDLLVVAPEDSKQIRIEQIRGLIEWAMQTAQQGGRKLCVLNPADKMNIQSANALLKVLEEPPADTVLCLVTSQPSRLLPTLRSRCQKIEFNLPNREDALDWLSVHSDASDPSLLLDIANGNPLKAATVDEDYIALRKQIAQQFAALSKDAASVLETAAGFSTNDPELVVSILYQLVADSIRSSMTEGQFTQNVDLSDEIAELKKTSLRERYALLERVCRARGLLAGTSNPNLQMLMEWVLSGQGDIS